MGVGTLPIQNPTVGGGTAFNDIVAQLLATLAGTQGERAQTGLGLLGTQLGAETAGAQVGGNLLSSLLQAETAARRRPVNIVDQLLLAGEFGSVMPLSQISGERLSQLGGRTSPALGQLFRSLQGFTERRMAPPTESLTEQIQGFAQGAIPQAQLINLIRRPDQADRAVVRLPNGQIEIVPVPSGEGLQTVQGRAGPFSISIPDVQNFIQSAEQRIGGVLEGKTPQERQRILDTLGRTGEQTARGQEQVAEQFRTGSPADIQTLLGFLNAPAEVQQRFQRGGSLVVDPRRAQTTGAGARGIQAAGPIRMVDRNQQTIGIAGEGQRPERVNIEPLPIGLGGTGGAPRGEAPGQQVGGINPATMPRDVRFRFEDLVNAGIAPEQALAMAQNPGNFIGGPAQGAFGAIDRLAGVPPGGGAFDIIDALHGANAPVSGDPRAVAARLLGGALQSDVRFGDQFVQALALGRAPTSAQLNMAELNALPPDLREALIGIIGVDQFPGFQFALEAGTPTGAFGVRRRAAGGVRV